MFKRYYEERHIVGQIRLVARYDRYKRKLILRCDDAPVLSRHLWLLPSIKQTVLLNGEQYQLSVQSLFIWRSRLFKDDTLIIDELLTTLKRKSIGALVTSLLLSFARFFG